jgi:hypothetical protein
VTTTRVLIQGPPNRSTARRQTSRLRRIVDPASRRQGGRGGQTRTSGNYDHGERRTRSPSTLRRTCLAADGDLLWEPAVVARAVQSPGPFEALLTFLWVGVHDRPGSGGQRPPREVGHRDQCFGAVVAVGAAGEQP